MSNAEEELEDTEDLHDGDVDSDDSIRIRPIKTEMRKIMLGQGVPGQDFMGSGSGFDVTKYLVGMEINLPNVTSKAVGVEKQAEMLRRVIAKPLAKPMLIGISSYPSDARAKFVAHSIMSAAITEYETNRRKYGSMSRPMWHRVWGNYRDKLRDGPKERPAMLIISNISDVSGNAKMETVRDLLEMYSDIPRIVVSAGMPVVDLFSYHLQMPLSAGFYVGPPNLIKDSKV